MTEAVATSSRICRVCSESTFGCHFGIDSCRFVGAQRLHERSRACAAFFRRTVIERKVYVCRTGGKCIVDKSIKPLCRKCRLKKCLEKGMQASGVQVKSEEIDIINDDPNPISGFQLPILPYSGTKIFEKLVTNYKELRIIRKATERALDPNSYLTVVKSGPLAGYSLAKPENISTYFRAHTPSVIEFAANSIPGFHDLQEEERAILLKPFMVFFYWLDISYITYKVLPKEYYTTCCLLSETTFFDLEHKDNIVDPQEVPAWLAQDFEKLIAKELSGDRQRSLFTMDAMKIKEEEYAALICLIFWNNSVHGCSESVHALMRKYRGIICDELGRFFQETNEPSPFIRLGEILSVSNSILIETIRAREDWEVFKIFEAFDKFDFLYQMIRDAQ